MARAGIGFFDSRGEFFRSPEEATMSDLASLLGRIGEGDGMSLGIAKLILEKRRDIERLFADYDGMTADAAARGEPVPAATPQLRSVN